MTVSAVTDLIEQYEGDVIRLKETGDADDRFYAGVLETVIGDLQHL